MTCSHGKSQTTEHSPGADSNDEESLASNQGRESAMRGILLHNHQPHSACWIIHEIRELVEDVASDQNELGCSTTECNRLEEQVTDLKGKPRVEENESREAKSYND